jgi:Rps23 Pro-64 3,4-dihydroxylase Tpa1-like proline 4-hydroxylase
MNDSNYIDLSSLTSEDQPFPHFCSPSALQNGIELQLFDWFEHTKEWSLTEMDFYEQYEFNLLGVKLPNNLQCLIGERTIATIEEKFKSVFDIKSLDLVGVMAHKLVNGQKIGIHNDFINGDETHRLVLHINPHWNEENGGFLMLFSSSNAEDLARIINPINNTAFGFEISSRSHHAVSKIYDYIRYTVVYTFKNT